MAVRYAARRAEPTGTNRRPTTTEEERLAAQRELPRRPRDAGAGRLRNRDSVDGRPPGHVRKFGLSSIRLRQQAHAASSPGVTTSSW